MSDQIQSTLLEHFGFDEFRPWQRQVIENLVAGKSSAAVFPTGGGKSLCYQLPALLLPGGDAGRFAADRADERSD